MSNFGDIFGGVEKETNNFEPVPKGKYMVEVEKSEIKQTKAGTGFYVNIQMKIVSESCKGRVLFDILNIKNSNTVAEEIGKARLKLMLGLQGVEEKDMANKGPDFLIGKVFTVQIGIDKNDETRNKINAYFDGHTDMAMSASGNTADSADMPDWAK